MAENEQERKNLIEKITKGKVEGTTKRNNRMQINESQRIWTNLGKELR